MGHSHILAPFFQVDETGRREVWIDLSFSESKLTGCSGSGKYL